MRTTLNRLTIIASASLISTSALGINGKQAATTAAAFLRRAGIALSSRELRGLDARETGVARVAAGGQWSFMTGHRMIAVDDLTGEVTMYSDADLYGRAMDGPSSRDVARAGRPFYSSERALLAFAAARLDHLGWRHGSDAGHEPLPRVGPGGVTRRAIVYVKFSDHPNGYPAPGAGNFVVIGLDSLSGDVVELQRAVGYRYEPPGGRLISTQQAVSVARQVVATARSPLVIGPCYQQIDGRSDLSHRGRALCDSRTLPLAYCVVGASQEVLVIAADTGEVLSRRGGGSGAGPGRGGTESTPGKGYKPPPRPFPAWTLLDGAVFLALLAGLVVLVARRYRLARG